MTDAKFGLLLTAAAVIGLAVALHRRRALGRAGLGTVIAAVLAATAVLFLSQ
ncbi:hypothetical protein M2352_004655 [Azospirillum fermentarium]|uniref:hypothetical protein n=1 Tax=Azospirillum fermentarium TaxID=1233114 RepID=UPI0022272505|nr:hypothetical protein [Azospirillum fermentarium]MCW2248995.1 hypothetical protein [Azospirillum fermentarium]